MTPPAERRDVLELKRELIAAAHELAERGLCGCGCGEELGGQGGNGRKVFRDVRHRQRFRRRMLKRLAEASGVPANLSVRTLQATETTDERNGDAQTRRKRPRRAPRPGVSIYLPTPEVARLLEPLLEGHVARTREALASGEVRLATSVLERELANAELALEAIAKALERRRRRAA
jgi:hypothetical protein